MTDVLRPTVSIYGEFEPYLDMILEDFTHQIKLANLRTKAETNFKLYEHLIARVKTPDSMAEKCQRKGLDVSPRSALKQIKDSIGVRIICGFVDDIYRTVDLIKSLPGVSVLNEKDYIFNAKPNGYRSYHLILEVETAYPDVDGKARGSYYIEVQLRTIAQDSWASLEHQMKYKKDLRNPDLITRELKRCADELASCDLTMQTIRQLIQESGD